MIAVGKLWASENRKQGKGRVGGEEGKRAACSRCMLRRSSEGPWSIWQGGQEAVKERAQERRGSKRKMAWSRTWSLCDAICCGSRWDDAGESARSEAWKWGKVERRRLLLGITRKMSSQGGALLMLMPLWLQPASGNPR